MSDAIGSFESFFEEYYEQVRRALGVAFADWALAEDAAQEAFAQAYVQWRAVSVMERPAGWVYVVALRGGPSATFAALRACRAVRGVGSGGEGGGARGA